MILKKKQRGAKETFDPSKRERETEERERERSTVTVIVNTTVSVNEIHKKRFAFPPN